MVLADEPTGALDSRTAGAVLALLRASVDDLGQTVVMVTHDPVAASYADTVVFLVDGRVAGRMDAPPPTRSPARWPTSTSSCRMDGERSDEHGYAPGRSLRHRLTAFTATFLAVLLGTAMIGSFATLVETASGPVSSADEETLTIMGAVVGGWGRPIVLFSVASTSASRSASVTTEIGLLRTIGATPRQARRLIRTETLLVTLLAAVAGALVASSADAPCSRCCAGGDMVASDVDVRRRPASLGTAAGLVVLTGGRRRGHRRAARPAARPRSCCATRAPTPAGCAGGGRRAASSWSATAWRWRS